MKKTLALFLGFILIGTSAISERKHKIDAANFDGSKFMQRYSLSIEDFHAEYVDGEMFIVVHDGVSITSSPTFESSDTTKRDRLVVLRGTLRSGDLNVPEINEYLRLTAGL